MLSRFIFNRDVHLESDTVWREVPFDSVVRFTQAFCNRRVSEAQTRFLGTVSTKARRVNRCFLRDEICPRMMLEHGPSGWPLKANA